MSFPSKGVYCPFCGGPSIMVAVWTDDWKKYKCEGGQQDGYFTLRDHEPAAPSSAAPGAGRKDR